MSQGFTRGYANRNYHMKIRSFLLVIRDVQGKTTVYPAKIDKIRKLYNTNVDKVVEQLELIYTATGNVNHTTVLRNCLASSVKA